jgi:electron transfer flavoprotein alpha subunit
MSVLVVVEHNQRSIMPATLHAVGAAAQLNLPIILLVAGDSCRDVAEAAAKINGVTRVVLAEDAAYRHGLAEQLTPLLVQLAKQGFSHVLAAATSFGKNLMPRLAALLDVAQISEIVAIEAADRFVRPIYAGNALATVESADAIKVITVRMTDFAPAATSGGQATIESMAAVTAPARSHFVSQELSQSSRPDLAAAKIVVSGGRGLGSAENFKLVEALADRLGAAVGASRAAVDAGYVPNDYQVGQTGKVVAPELYLAIGISGAIQHLAGMSNSKVIVAINKDPDAPIFQVADYGLVGDLFQILPELTMALKG